MATARQEEVRYTSQPSGMANSMHCQIALGFHPSRSGQESFPDLPRGFGLLDRLRDSGPPLPESPAALALPEVDDEIRAA